MQPTDLQAALSEANCSSPEYVRLSMAAAMALGYRKGWFWRGARCWCINLLQTYPSGCLANCAYCGLARQRQGDFEDKSFIRVEWPLVAYEDVLQRIQAKGEGVKRLCISMVTSKQSALDVFPMLEQARQIAPAVPRSVLIAPTVVDKAWLEAIKKAGVDYCGIAVDAATPELFDLRRGAGVRGPHKWDTYWQRVREAVEVFGKGKLSLHLVFGLGETEQEFCEAMQRVVDEGAQIHLFSFYPEPGSAMADVATPPMEGYRRMQLAACALERGWARFEDFTFAEDGRLRQLGISPEQLEALLSEGAVFMTRGCPAVGGELACNRPYANERPDDVLRNYPFFPTTEDLALIRETVKFD